MDKWNMRFCNEDDGYVSYIAILFSRHYKREPKVLMFNGIFLTDIINIFSLYYKKWILGKKLSNALLC